MTPQEKAREMFDKYYLLNANTIDENNNWVTLILNTELAKKCALIAVDEILNNDNNFFNTYSQNDYWLQVKQEINKL